MSINEIKKIIWAYKPNLCKKYHIKQIGVFGSYVRGEERPHSDIDILVDFSRPISLFEFIDMEAELSTLLDMKVDLVSRKSLKPHIGKHILQEVELV
mgnify:FL=1